MKHLICISCPKGCHLTVDETNGYAVSGNSCPKGKIYGKSEVQNPQRIVTSTVAVSGSRFVRCSIKTDRPIPKKLMIDAVKLLNGFCIQAPVKQGQTILRNICGTDANFITTRGIE